jgi:Type IV secretion system pilin
MESPWLNRKERTMTHLAILLTVYLHVTLLPAVSGVLADVGTSFGALAGQFAGYLTGILTFIAVVSGYALMTAGEDVQQATRAKRALGMSLAGAVLVGTAITLAPVITGNIK